MKMPDVSVAMADEKIKALEGAVRTPSFVRLELSDAPRGTPRAHGPRYPRAAPRAGTRF